MYELVVVEDVGGAFVLVRGFCYARGEQSQGGGYVGRHGDKVGNKLCEGTPDGGAGVHVLRVELFYHCHHHLGGSEEVFFCLFLNL